VREIAPHVTYESFRRGFVFLDPYGLQVRWSTAETLARTRALDVFVNFPIMGINRLIPRDSLPDTQALERLELIFEDTAWIESLYSTQGGLFGETTWVRNRMDSRNLAERYIADIRGLFPHVSQSVIMRNSTSSPLYALFLASHNATAVGITNSILKSYARRSLP
jgi:three-Cys-motif partner protein